MSGGREKGKYKINKLDECSKGKEGNERYKKVIHGKISDGREREKQLR